MNIKLFADQPKGLPVLFMTEMWERFSYYGMRTLLLLFMTATIAEGGLGMGIAVASAIYGLYTFGVYALALPGGWIADNILGQRKAVLIGGSIIAIGHYSMAIPATGSFFLGLILVILGTGLLKPNVSAIVGDLYPEGGANRDKGFSIFYMGINVGAVFGPAICSFLGEKVNWHLGFGAAAIGMTLALVQYVYGRKHLHGMGELKDEASKPENIAKSIRQLLMGVAFVTVIALVLVALGATDTVNITLIGFAQSTGFILFAVAVLYFLGIIFFGAKNTDEKKRITLILFLFLGAMVFWGGFEQAGSSMNIFARDFTDRVIGGFEIPAGLLQTINPIFIILLAPVIGTLWVKLGDRNPSIPTKFGMGLVLLGVGFFVMSWGSQYIQAGKVSPMWLVVTYFFHTVGELSLSPVGLSSITKLSPKRYVSQMMGTWFLGAALGNLVAGLVAGYVESFPQTLLYGIVAGTVAVFGILFLIFSRPINKLARGIK